MMWLTLGVGVVAAAAVGGWALWMRPVDIAKAPALSGTYQHVSLAHGGLSRSYGLYLSRPDAAARGIIVVLHGSLGSGAQFRRWTGGTFDALGDRLGVAVVYPDGWKRHWNDCRRAGAYAAKTENVDDVGFIEQVVARVAGGRSTRVGVVGYSNGGFMALRWALEGTSRLDGMVLAGAAVPAESNMVCAERRPLPPAMLVAGTQDTISPYEGGRVRLLGGDRGEVRSAADSARWIAGPGATAVHPPSLGESKDGVRRTVWVGERGSRAGLVTLEGGGHTMPQPWTRFPSMLGRTIPTIDTADLAAEVFGWE